MVVVGPQAEPLETVEEAKARVVAEGVGVAREVERVAVAKSAVVARAVVEQAAAAKSVVVVRAAAAWAVVVREAVVVWAVVAREKPVAVPGRVGFYSREVDLGRLQSPRILGLAVRSSHLA